MLDTVDIENFISVSKTEGPQLAAAMERHVRDYEVDIMNLQTASKLIPAATEGGLIDRGRCHGLLRIGARSDEGALEPARPGAVTVPALNPA